jgi:CheY-like chemotaxis protein
MTELALDTDLNDEQREYLNIVKSSSDSLLKVINDILDFSKIEAGKLLIEHIPFNLGQTMGDTLKALAVRAHDKGIELVCEIDADVPMAVVGDPGRLRQVLLNLLGNSVKFTDRGEVMLHLSMKPLESGRASFQFVISDTGIGIARSKLDSIFEAFSQEDSTITRRYGGTGLGLSISALLVEALGGKISVQSELGQGSQFQFSIPLGLEAHTVQAQGDGKHLDGLRVLVVDDNEVIRRCLSAVLQQRGAQVQCAASGQQALALVSERQASGFDVVFVDERMPAMDGFATARSMLALPSCQGLAMILMSSAGLKGEAHRLRDVGVAAYLSKPFVPDDVAQVLERVLSSSASLKSKVQTRSPEVPKHIGLNVLLVEDHKVNQQLAIALLKRWGHSVSLAENGQQALNMLAEKRFDLVLMDMMMPVMDGLEATRRFRAVEQLPRTPIVAMTANAMQSDRDNCLAAGMDDYLSKPIDTRELQTILRRYEPKPKLTASTIDPGSSSPHAAVQVLPSGFDYVAALAASDQEVVDIIAQAFLDQWPLDLQKLQRAVGDTDARTVTLVAHALKGTLAMFGARPAAELAQRMEALAARAELAGLPVLTLALVVEIDLLLVALHRSRSIA